MSLTLDRAIGLAEPSPPEMRRHAFHLSAAGRVLLAVLSGAAGVIHLAMVPSHWGSSAVEGIGFAVTGWAQIVIAVLLLTSPTRPLLRVTMLVNVFAVGVWMISRTWGLPFGAEAGHPHDAQFIDLVCVGIEVALVVLAAWWLEHPAFGSINRVGGVPVRSRCCGFRSGHRGRIALKSIPSDCDALGPEICTDCRSGSETVGQRLDTCGGE